VCGLAPQCGCSAGQTCDVTDDTGTTACVTAGSGPTASPCTRQADCAAGLTCVLGACRPYCATASQACTGASVGTCFDAVTTAGGPIPNKNVCTIACDPRAPTACGTNTCAFFSTS